MITERFTHCRKDILEKLLDKDQMKKIWKEEIRDNLRRNILQDFHDYSDFHENVDDQIKSLSERVLNGQYVPKKPLWFKQEKKLGVSRLLVLPAPDDALLLQTITKSLSKEILKVQPFKNVYFSQLRHQPQPRLDQMSNESNESRSKLFKIFRETSLGFASGGRYIVTTDLSNYFDSVLLTDLRHVVSQWFTHHEVEIDLLFRILDAFSVCPDYLPPRGRGIPTIDLDAPRLLAHVYLFEVDQVMRELTSSNYTRWMDDIVFAASSYVEAREILGKLNDLLRSRGLSLNLQKTEIQTSAQYYKSVMYDENKYLDGIFALIDKGPLPKGEEQRLIRKWKSVILLKETPRTWDKILKRYIGASKKVKNPFIVKNFSSLFFRCPSVRDQLCLYISQKGYSVASEEQVRDVFKSPYFFDDTALVHLTSVVAGWNIPYDRKGKSFVSYIDSKLKDLKSDMGQYAHVYFKTIHSTRRDLLNLLKEKVPLISGDSFYARQILCCIPLVWNEDKIWCESVLKGMAYERFNSNSRIAKRILDQIDGNFKTSQISRQFFYKLSGNPMKHSKLISLIPYLVGNATDEKNEMLLRVIENVSESNQLELIFRSIDQ